MKKIRIFAICLLTAVCALCVGCRSDRTPTESVYETLEKAKSAAYSQIALSVSARVGGETLSASYVTVRETDAVKVTYSYEKLNGFESDGAGGYRVPSSRKSVLTGTAEIKDGTFVEIDGAPSNISVAAVTATGFSFASAHFTNVSVNSGTFEAEVTDPAAFIGGAATATDMNVKVRYGDKFESIEVSYAAPSADVVLTYTFTA